MERFPDRPITPQDDAAVLPMFGAGGAGFAIRDPEVTACGRLGSPCFVKEPA